MKSELKKLDEMATYANNVISNSINNNLKELYTVLGIEPDNQYKKELKILKKMNNTLGKIMVGQLELYLIQDILPEEKKICENTMKNLICSYDLLINQLNNNITNYKTLIQQRIENAQLDAKVEEIMRKVINDQKKTTEYK
jgi:hypothetical protein